MRLLLDTHVLLWSLIDPERIDDRAAKELDRAGNELWLSPISSWEILVLAEKGRITLGGSSCEDWLRRALATAPLREAPLNHEIAIQSSALKMATRDPADRFIAATAIVHDLTLVTADEALLACERLRTLRAS
jgi:PIN domain nuclease of toxin-antitoxin system